MSPSRSGGVVLVLLRGDIGLSQSLLTSPFPKVPTCRDMKKRGRGDSARKCLYYFKNANNRAMFEGYDRSLFFLRRKAFKIDESKIPGVGAKVRCPKCQTIFPVTPAGPQPEVKEALRLPRCVKSPLRPRRRLRPLSNGSGGRAPSRPGGWPTSRTGKSSWRSRRRRRRRRRGESFWARGSVPSPRATVSTRSSGSSGNGPSPRSWGCLRQGARRRYL